MRVNVDKAACSGHARCNAAAPDVFPLDDMGYVDIDGAVEVASGLEEQARLGVAACPERALSLLTPDRAGAEGM